MTLIIENGTNVAGANSYATLTEIRAFASARGVTLSAVDATLEVQAIKAMDYLESLRDSYKGTKKYSDQSLQWPRLDVLVDGYELASTSIPTLLKNSQAQLCIEIHNGVDIMPTSTGGSIKREKVDVIEIEYQPSASSIQKMRAFEGFLSPLLKSGFAFRTLRV